MADTEKVEGGTLGEAAPSRCHGSGVCDGPRGLDGKRLAPGMPCDVGTVIGGPSDKAAVEALPLCPDWAEQMNEACRNHRGIADTEKGFGGTLAGVTRKNAKETAQLGVFRADEDVRRARRELRRAKAARIAAREALRQVRLDWKQCTDDIPF